MRNVMFCTIMFKFCLLLGVLLAETSASWKCNDGEVRCLWTNGSCIAQDVWCDDEMDCEDGSDEDFCYGAKCTEDLFTCDNGRCVPIETECNGYDNCGDGSDERCDSGIHRSMERSNTKVAIVEAIHSLLVHRKSDYGWDEFTPRALVALAFGQEYLPIPEKEKILMMKRLDLQLLLLLKEDVQSLATLAHNINALYAMCKDPRDFHGLDLVELLRSKTDGVMTPDFNLPIVFLTLCLANKTKPEDFSQLIRIYDDDRNNRMGVKALTLVAMLTCSRQDSNRLYQSDIKMQNFIHLARNKDIDVQSKALVCQAYNARGYDSKCGKELMSIQSEDGSFGDLLGTYSAIPALLNLSLADLQCKTRHYEVKPASRLFSNAALIFKPEKQIDYSLWIRNGENAGNHTLRLSYEGDDKSFYDLMKMAEQKNNMYRFKYDELMGTGKKVYYLAGIPNDAEKGYGWNLYRQVARNAANVRSIKERDGVDRLYPIDGDHFIFQLDNTM